METPRTSRDLKSIIEQIWKEMGNHVGSPLNQPREKTITYIDWRRNGYSPQSAVYHPRSSYRMHPRAVSVIIDSAASDEVVRAKLVELQDKATKVQATAISIEKEKERMDREREAREKEERRAWVAMLRVAFGGDPSQELPPDLAPKVITNHQLLEAGRQGYFQLRLPDDFPKRARLLATIDAALASDTK